MSQAPEIGSSTLAAWSCCRFDAARAIDGKLQRIGLKMRESHRSGSIEVQRCQLLDDQRRMHFRITLDVLVIGFDALGGQQ